MEFQNHLLKKPNVIYKHDTYYVKNYFNKDVAMSKKTYENFIKLNKDHIINNEIQDTGFFPYQSIDMHKVKEVRFAKKNDFMLYEKSKKDFEKKMEDILNNYHKNKMIHIWTQYFTPLKTNNMNRYEYYNYLSNKNKNWQKIYNEYNQKNNIGDAPWDYLVFSSVSDIEIHKMRRNNNDYNYKYLIQLDNDNITKHMYDILKVMDRQVGQEDISYTFIPYIPNTKIMDNYKLDPHNIYTKIKIVNNEQFMDYLKGLITDKNILGKFLYDLNKVFYYYDNMLEILAEYTNEIVTPNNLIDIVVKIQQQLIWGLNKQAINKRLYKRNELLKSYAQNKYECDGDKLYNDYYEWLAEQKKIMGDNDKFLEILNCNSIKIKPDELIVDKPMFETCKNMPFIPTDNYDKYTFANVCQNIIKNINNFTIKTNFSKIIEKNVISTRCFRIPPDLEGINKFNLFEECMPEWYDLTYNNDFVNAYNHRQLLLGGADITSFFRKCSIFFRSDPFISRACDLPGIIHDAEWNKTIVSCIANSNDIFPIRIIDGKKIESLNIYENFEIKQYQDKLIGSFIIKLKGLRTNLKERYYITYIYYNETGPLKLVNFKNNVLVPGSIIEYTRLLYLELNTLMFYSNDIGTKLHFYKLSYNDTFDIFVSKYELYKIKNIYKKMREKYNDPTYLNGHYEDKLEEITITKDADKMFKFEPLHQKNIYGGNKNNDNFVFKFMCPDNYKWDIHMETNNIIFDKEVFSVSLYKKQLALIYQFEILAKEKIFDIACTPLAYLKNVTVHKIGNITKKDINQLWEQKGDKKIDSTKKMYKNTLKILEETKSVLSYNFESNLSIWTYRLFNEYLFNRESNNFLVFGVNNYMLDGLLFYYKFKQLKSQPNVKFFAYEAKHDLYPKIQNYLDINKIKKISIKNPMDNNWIKENESHVNKVDVSLVDIIIGIDGLNNIRYAYIFQSQLPPLILTLKKLNKGGIIMLNMCLIPNKMIFNFITYLSCYFENTFISDTKESDMYSTGQLISTFIVFDKYLGDIDIDKLLKLNEKMFECDPTGGYLFDTKNKELKKELNINYENDNAAKKYITNIITINDPNINDKYKEYKEYCKMKLLGSIRNFNDRYDNFINKDKDYFKDKCDIAKMKAIYYAKKYDLPLLDWVNEIPNVYFDKTITNKLKNIDYTTQDQLNCNGTSTISVNTKLKCDNCDILIKNIEISESAYMYIEKINYDAYKNVELFINNKYKKLNNQLLDEYDININDKYVSRAWIKMYELLFDTKLLERYYDKLDVFFMCEAPGNFVNSMDYFIKKNTNIKKFNWNAQSLSQMKADFYDSYGFIKKTIDKWDMGPKKTGDILDSENQRYYFKRYANNVDMLVGDCGEKWNPNDKNNSKDLSIYQLFYALMIPKVGGCFIIKTFSSNNNKLYLSLLYTLCTKYEKIITFKSNTNFWSPEIYIIGIGNKGLSDKEKQNLSQLIEKTNNDETVFPVAVLPEEFIGNYNNIMYNYISYASDIKKFFIFLATNEDIYEKNKDNITKIIFEKNKGWLKKYIGEKMYKF